MVFLVDAQLPPALARWLSAKGYQATHVSDIGMQSATDDEIWDLAVAERAVIMTKDEDFANSAFSLPRGRWSFAFAWVMPATVP